MKKYILSLVILAITLNACDNFIEEENLSNVVAEEFYLTANGYETLINANYSNLRAIYGDQAWLFCSGTDLYAEGRDPEPVGLSQYSQLNSSSEGVEHLYNTCYEAIQAANMALYYADLTEQTSNLSARVGEVEYLRANAYFLLVQTYGGISIVTEYLNSPVLEFDRNTAEEVYNLIIMDLESSLNKVSTSSYNGRVNKRAVEHLLAKVYLTKGYESFGTETDFSKAASYADNAIDGQTLSIPYADLWTPGNEMNGEVIFSVQYSSGSISSDPLNEGNRQYGYFSSYLGGSDVADDAPWRSFNLCPTDFAIGLYDEGDERWEATFMTEAFTRYYDFYDVIDHSTLDVAHFYEPKWFSEQDQTDYLAAHPSVVGDDYHEYGTYVPSIGNENYSTIPVKKFDDPTSLFGARNNDGKVSSRDVILSRLGDTYLLSAEAYYQAGNTSLALDRLNEVRGRAGADNVTVLDIDYILDERARELLGEYHRWFDLKRTGKLKERASLHHYLIEESNFNGANGELKILRPIPQEAIDLNQNLDFTQNPAYQ